MFRAPSLSCCEHLTELKLTNIPVYTELPIDEVHLDVVDAGLPSSVTAFIVNPQLPTYNTGIWGCMLEILDRLPKSMRTVSLGFTLPVLAEWDRHPEAIEIITGSKLRSAAMRKDIIQWTWAELNACFVS